jgi:signal transduction histidine kinase
MLSRKVLLFALLACSSCFSETLFLSQNMPAWSKATQFIDSSSKLTFTEVRRKNFEPLRNPDSVPDFGFGDKKIWLRLQIKNDSQSSNYVLALDHIYLNEVDFFLENERGDFDKTSLGLNIPFDSGKQEIEYYGFAVGVKLPVGSIRTLYISAKSNYPISLPLKVYEKVQFHERLRVLDRIFWAYIGLIGILIIYNTFIFLWVGDPAYFYYIMTLMTFHLFGNLAQYGMVRTYFLPTNVWFHSKVFYFCHCLALICLTAFVKKFIRLKETFPNGAHCLNVLLFTTTGIFISGLVLNTYWVDLLFQLNTTVYFFVLLAIALTAAGRGNRQAKFFSLAWSCLIISWIYNFLRIDGVVARNLFTDHVVLLGAAVEGTLLSLALADRLNLLRKQKEEAERKVAEGIARAQVARQVAHDIRSPLTALEAATSDLSGLSEGRRLLIRNAATRIKDIANDLIRKEKMERTGFSQTLLSSLLELLLSEKRAQFRNRPDIIIEEEIAPNSYGIFVRVDPTEFKRVVSNLIDNAVEAVRDAGVVKVSLATKDSFGILFISDNGCGIPGRVLTKLGETPMSYGKEGLESGAGSGLGVYDANQKLKFWGGSLKFHSQEGKGTRVEISLPLAKPPSWFVDGIKVDRTAKIAIVDDDLAIHALWKERFSEINAESSACYFTDPQSFLDWYKDRENHLHLILIDQEFLENSVSGLELIIRNQLQSKAILVTSKFESREIQELCSNEHIHMLPKPLAGVVPINNDENSLSKN